MIMAWKRSREMSWVRAAWGGGGMGGREAMVGGRRPDTEHGFNRRTRRDGTRERRGRRVAPNKETVLSVEQRCGGATTPFHSPLHLRLPTHGPCLAATLGIHGTGSLAPGLVVEAHSPLLWALIVVGLK